jgi:hypothetical protein
MTEMESTRPVPSGSEARGLNVLEAAVAVITRPASAMLDIAVTRAWPAGLLLSMAATLLNALSTLAGRPANLAGGADLADLPPELAGTLATLQSPQFLIVSSVVISLPTLVFWTGVLYLVGRLLGGRGAFGGLLATQGFASVPNFLLAPVAAMLNLAGGPLTFVGWLLGFGFFIWTFVLGVIGIRESLAFSTGKAIATALIPFAILFAMAMAAVAIFIAWIVSMFNAVGAP